MPISPHPITQAATVLTTGPGTTKEKLVLGCKLIWAATILPGDWTPALLERANSIYHGLVKNGSLLKTVELMDENTAEKCFKQLAMDTVELAAEVERGRSRGRP